MSKLNVDDARNIASEYQIRFGAYSMIGLPECTQPGPTVTRAVYRPQLIPASASPPLLYQ